MRTRHLAALLVMACALRLACAADDVEPARLAIRTKQFAQAVELLQRGARSGSADAQYLLGLALWNGVGVNAERAAARDSLGRAAQAGHAAAAYALAALLAGGTAPERAEASSWLARAAAAGYAPAIALQATHQLPLADARGKPSQQNALRFEIARVAARGDDAALLTAVGAAELVGQRGEFGRTLLIEAAESGSATTAGQLLRAGAAPDQPDDYGQTPLMLAAAQPNVSVTSLLLGARAHVDAADHAGRTALFRAAAANLPEQIAALLAAHADFALADQRGWTAFDLAQQRDAQAALDALRAAGAHAGTAVALAPRGAVGIDATRPGILYQGWPPLLIAVARDDAADVRRRAAAGADLEATTPQGQPALQVAIESRAAQVTPVLLELGANPRRKGSDGLDTIARVVRAGDASLFATLVNAGVKPGGGSEAAELLAVAVDRGDAAMTRALLAAGISAKAADAEGMTPLMHAARRGDEDMIKLLLDRGADAVAIDARGRSALWYAAAANSAPGVEVLLAMHLHADAADRDGVTPLLAAIRTGSAANVARMLTAGTAVDGPANNRHPPLGLAAQLGHAALVTLLLEHKPEIDATDEFGDTALMAAARNGNAAICVQLLGAGANPRLRNRERATAAELADARGFKDLAQRLRS